MFRRFNRTFLVRFGSIPGEFARAMVRILARRSRAKIPMARPNVPDTLPNRTKKGAIYHTYIRPKTRRYFFVHASARQCSRDQFWREIAVFFSRLTNVIVLRFVVFLL